MRDVADYVAVAIINNGRENPFYSRSQDFSGDLQQLKAHAEELCGFSIPQEILDRAIRTLADCSLVRITDDPYSGLFIKVRSSGFDDFVRRADEEISKAFEEGNEGKILTSPSDFPAAAALAKHEVIEDYKELGSDWFNKAIDGLRRNVEEGGVVEGAGAEAQRIGDTPVPASDRVVTLSDNQQKELEETSTELIEAVEKENSIGGNSTLRQRILGELKAARELIRSQTLRAYLLYQTLMSALSRLIDRYQGHAIAVTASKLLELLIEHVFKG